MRSRRGSGGGGSTELEVLERLAGAGDGVRVPVERGTGRVALFVQGGGCGHGTAVMDVVAPGEWERRWRVLEVGDVYRWRGEREVWRLSWGRRMGTWDGESALCGTPGSGSGGSGALWSYGGVSGSRSGASGAWGRVRRGAVVGNGRAVGGSVVQGASGSAAVCGSRLLRGASRAILAGVGGAWWASRSGGGYLAGREVLRSPRACRVGLVCRVRWCGGGGGRWYGFCGRRRVCPGWGWGWGGRGSPAWTWWPGGYWSW